MQKKQNEEAGQARKRRGSGRATIHDVARSAGVGSITVSRYLKEPGKVSAVLGQRIVAAIAELNYVPNQVAGLFASSHGRIVGMVIPNISGPIFANTIQRFSDVLSRHGYQLLLASSYFDSQQEESAVRAFLGWKPAALVVTSQHHTAATEQMLAHAGIPVVESWDYEPGRPHIQVGFSHRRVGAQAARYLIAQGYQRIAFVQNSAAGDISALDRRDGYAEVMAEHGLATWCYAPTEAAPFDAGRQAMEALTGCPKPADAIIYANDNLAAGGLLAAQRAGLRIPQQCAMIGFGDYAFAPLLLPSLTTIRPPAAEIGEVAALRILQTLGAVEKPESFARLNLLECELVKRESA